MVCFLKVFGANLPPFVYVVCTTYFRSFVASFLTQQLSLGSLRDMGLGKDKLKVERYSPEDQGISPENQWLEDVFPIKKVLF